MRGPRLVSTTIVVAPVGISCAAAAAARPHSAAAKPAPTVLVRSTSSYGKILVNGKGYTLYLWTKDKPNKSACSGPCLGVWPFVLVSGTPTGGPSVNAKLLGTISVSWLNPRQGCRARVISALLLIARSDTRVLTTGSGYESS